MGKAFGLVVMLISLYIGMTIYTKNFQQAFAPIQPMSQRDTPLATGLTPAAELADAPSGGENRPVKITDAVRSQVSADMALGADRHGFGAASD